MSSIPDVLDKLVELGSEILPNSQVIYGPPASVTTLDDRVLVVADRPVRAVAELDSMSLDSSSENYVVPMAVSVDVAGTDQRTAVLAAIADYEAMEKAIREHPLGPSLGLGEPTHVLPTGDFELQQRADDNGRHAAVLFSVQVYAQIT